MGSKSYDAAKRRFVIAVDFGSTFSAVAYATLDSGGSKNTGLLHRSQCIDHYPEIPPAILASTFVQDQTVPSEVCYSLGRTAARYINGSDPVIEPENFDDSAYDSPLDDEGGPSLLKESTRKVKTHPSWLEFPSAKHVTCWGYGVQRKFSQWNLGSANFQPITKLKLLLDQEVLSTGLHHRAIAEFEALKAANVVQNLVDPIADYLTHLLKHTKNRLAVSEALEDDDSIEFVLCVPNMWTPKTCRTLQRAMTTAIENSHLGRLENGTVKDLFIVDELEAAAISALASDPSSIDPGETFIVLDCGGGTVDAATYQVIQKDPFSLAEVIAPKGVLCGSSSLDEEFRSLLKIRLKDATISGTDVELLRIIDATVIQWERTEKRRIDITDRNKGFAPVFIPGLRADADRRFRTDRLCINWKEMKNVYKGCLRGVARLLREQLQQAAAARDEKTDAVGLSVQKVILTGGFAESPSLQKHIENVLSKEHNLLGERIQLVCLRNPESAVARGAVLRALNKRDGPARISRVSFGVLCTDLFDDTNPAHHGLRGRRDPSDGEQYITNTIHWLINVGDLLPVDHIIRVRRRHTFRLNQKTLVCKEQLWISEKTHKSGYRMSHTENEGAEEEGRIMVDLTPLRAQPETYLKTYGKPDGTCYTFWEIEFDLCLVIDDRNLRFEARLPTNSEEVTSSMNISIAAAFVPGTA
ncbi:hypothetical protein LTS15_002754 [Exophiala xenobiotica]|nr:hypothetical protein LTS15_002754 [Exophiala xenobiotica]